MKRPLNIKLDFFVTDYGNNNSPAITYYVVKYTKKSTKDNFSLYSQFTYTSGTSNRLENICMTPKKGKISVYSEKDSEYTYYFDKLICYDEIYNGIYSPMEIKVQYKEGPSAEWIALPADQIQLSNATEYDLKNFPIVRRRPNLTTYVRFTAKNIVSEEHVLETQIPASDYVKNINIRTSTTGIDFSYSPFNANSASNCFIIITDANNNLLANYKGNPPILNKTNYPDGFYYLYTIPFYQMSENSNPNQVNIGAASISYKIKIEWNGSTGTVTPIYAEAPSSITFPQVSLELLPPEVNTGKRTVKVTTDYTNASENVRYRLLCYSNHDDFTVNETNYSEFTKYGCIQENGKFLFPENSDGEIVVKSGYSYNTKIVAYDLNNVNKGEKNLPDIIDATFDNIISDTFSFTLLANSYNDFSLKSGSTVYLDETDLKKNEENKVIVKKYIKKIESQSDRIYLSSTKLTKELLDKIPQADTEILLFDPVKKLQNDIPIRFDYLDYGLYSLIFMKEDNNGNYKIFCKTIYHKYKNGLELKKKEGTPNAVEFSNNIKTDDNSSASYFDGTDFIKSTGHYNSGGSTSPYLYNLNDYTGKFIKLSNYLESLSSDYRYYNVYFCPNYYLNNLTLKRKMMFKYDNEYQILADQPALIQLVQSDIKLTTEPEDWDMRAQTIEYKQISDDYLYKVDLSKITKRYYAVLVHFADGSTKMISDIR